MSIHKIGSDLVRPAGPKGPDHAAASGSKHADGEEPRRVDRADRVDISAEGRELAARLTEGEELSRTDRARARMERGYYDDPSVAQAVAERLIDSGDLDIRA